MDSGKDAQSAMEDAFCEMPSEIVGLLLALDSPDKIFFSRINQPMFASFTDHGAYLATTAIAFPDDAGEPMLLPSNSSGYISRSDLHISPFKNPPCTVAPITAKLRHEAYPAVCEELSKGNLELWDPLTNYNLAKCVDTLFEKADCNPSNALVYDIFHSLYRDGRLDITPIRHETTSEGVFATRFKLGLK